MLGLGLGSRSGCAVASGLTSWVLGKMLGLQQKVSQGRSPLGHSMSCSSCLCRACSLLTTVWCTASSPSVSKSRSSRRMAVRTLFWGHRVTG